MPAFFPVVKPDETKNYSLQGAATAGADVDPMRRSATEIATAALSSDTGAAVTDLSVAGGRTHYPTAAAVQVARSSAD